jgi:hypothetical protein
MEASVELDALVALTPEKEPRVPIRLEAGWTQSGPDALE